ncbi:MAG: hypothetical protein IKU25_05445 [Clostridia bacterium]|nr:hypothetical protein [Clostridia bacterium]
MKKTANKKFTVILTCIGVMLILAAVGLMLFSHLGGKNAQTNAKEIVNKMYSLMPDVKNSAPDGRSNVNMPMLEIDGTDFVGIIEASENTLPIYCKWDSSEVTKYPCRYMGSMHDGSLIIGGSDNKGQFDFVKTISNGESIFITDTTGLRFRYTVTDINRTKDVSTDYLSSQEADLILFARNTYSLDYTVILCDLL